MACESKLADKNDPTENIILRLKVSLLDHLQLFMDSNEDFIKKNNLFEINVVLGGITSFLYQTIKNINSHYKCKDIKYLQKSFQETIDLMWDRIIKENQ